MSTSGRSVFFKNKMKPLDLSQLGRFDNLVTLPKISSSSIVKKQISVRIPYEEDPNFYCRCVGTYVCASCKLQNSVDK